MVMPKKYYSPMVEKVRMPLLDMVENGKGVIEVVCVDEDGSIIAYLFNSMAGALWDARQKLEDSGFSTDWAIWDEEGKFLRVI